MANLLRMAKSGSDWTAVQFCAYNIIVELQDVPTFFGVDPLPQVAVAGELLKHVTADEMVDTKNTKLLKYMEMAKNPLFGEFAIVDFAAYLLSLLGYDAPVSRYQVGMQVCSFSLLPICGQECLATVDVHIQDDQNIILLLVQEMQHMERN